MLITAILDNGL